MARSFHGTVVLWAAALFPPLAAQQPAVSDEIRVSSQPYVAQASYTFRADARLVEIGVAVRDRHGRAVPGLKSDDFRIYDDGQEREIAAFSENPSGSADSAIKPATAPPPAAPTGGAVAAPPVAVPMRGAVAAPAVASPTRFLALFFDDKNATYGEETADLKRTQAAAGRYVKASLKPGIQMGIFTASGTPLLDFTADAQKLLETIDAVKIHPQFSEKVCSGMNPYQAYRIAVQQDRETLRLAVVAAGQHRCSANPEFIKLEADEVWSRVKQSSLETLAAISRVVNYLGGKPGERVLLLASTGFAAGTLEPQQDRIIDQAVHAGVVINSLVTKGLYDELPPGERFDDPAPQRAVYTALPRYQAWAKAEAAEVAERPIVMDEAMGNLAEGTGGVLFHNNNDLNAGIRETSVPPQVTYRLSFNPQGVVSDGSYHKLQVKLVHGASYSVEARPGYFARDETPEDQQQASLDKEVMGSDALTGVPATLALQVEKPSETHRTVRVIAHVDISKLEFAKQNGRQSQRLTIVAAFFDPQGKIVTAKEGRMDLALKPETYSRLAGTGVNAELTFLVSPGIYKLRAVVEEAVTGRMASSTYPVEVR